MKSKTLRLQASSIVCMAGSVSDEVVASVTCTDLDDLMDQVLGGDLQVEAFEFIKRNFDSEYLAEVFELGKGEGLKFFTCPKCHLTYPIKKITHNEICNNCLASEMIKESEL